MESLDQEIAHYKQMAREYNRIANTFTFFCCCTGIPFLLIGTFDYNSKAKRCWRRIRELEEQEQQTQETLTIYCQSCGHTIREVLEFCPQCGEVIKDIEEYRIESAKLQQETDNLEFEDEMLYQEIQLKNFEKKKKFAIITSSIVIPVSIILAFFAPVVMGLCNVFNLVSLIISISIIGKVPKGQAKPLKPLILSLVSIALTLGLFFLALFLTSNDPNFIQPIEPLWRHF